MNDPSCMLYSRAGTLGLGQNSMQRLLHGTSYINQVSCDQAVGFLFPITNLARTRLCRPKPDCTCFNMILYALPLPHTTTHSPPTMKNRFLLKSLTLSYLDNTTNKFNHPLSNPPYKANLSCFEVQGAIKSFKGQITHSFYTGSVSEAKKKLSYLKIWIMLKGGFS